MAGASIPGLCQTYLGALWGAVLLASVLWVAYVLAIRVTGAAGPSVRWCAAAVLAYWLLEAAFLVLATAGVFRLWVALPLWVAAAATTPHLLGGFGAPLRRLRADVAALRYGMRRLLRWPAGLLLVAGALIIALRTQRGLVAPPLAWDALTYHLFKAGRWVQAGGFAPQAAPDAWGYYRYFPPFGDVPWAWAMLPVHGDALLAIAGALIWCSCVLGAYGAARVLGAPRQQAALAGAVVGFTPAVVSLLTTAYAENLTLALFLLGFVFVKRAIDGGGFWNTALAFAALVIGVGVKLDAVIFVVLAVVVLAVATPARQLEKRRWLPIAAGGLLGSLVAVPPYATVWRSTGSPTYPVPVVLGETTVFAGNAELAGVLSGVILPHHLVFSVRRLVSELFLPRVAAVIRGKEFIGLGPSVPLLLILGTVGAVSLLRGPPDRWAAMFLLASAALAVASLMPRDVFALRTEWIHVLGRFLTVPVAIAAVLAARPRNPAIEPALGFALAVNLLLAIPRGWGALDVHWVPLLLSAVCVVLAAAQGVARVTRRSGPAVACAVIGLSAVYLVGGVRARAERYRYYRAAAAGEVYDLHTIDGRWASAWPIWRYFDRRGGVTLAAAAGWDGVGHNWYRYPLLGAHLQNRVLYVPITADGRIVNYRDPAAVRRRADFEAWVRRLVRRKVQYVVVLPPAPIEALWAQTHPELFVPVVDGVAGWSRAYRFVGVPANGDGATPGRMRDPHLN